MYRKGTFLDCEKVYHLICEMESKELPYDRFCEIFRKQLSSDSYYCLVCDVDEEVIGVLNLRTRKKVWVYTD